MTDCFKSIKEKLHENSPLIHCITNPISINDCANLILAAGAKPIMAEHPNEVSQITSNASSLMVNLGNITDVRMKSMLLSGEVARNKGIPCLIDVVGVSCSTLRYEYALNFIETVHPTVIKGNASEIEALSKQKLTSEGVDAKPHSLEDTINNSRLIAKKYNCIVVSSGKTDIITDGKITYAVKNGSTMMSELTGTGCMLGALIAAYLSVDTSIESVACAATVFGISGEQAEKVSHGIGSFHVNLFDCFYNLRIDDITKYADIENLTN